VMHFSLHRLLLFRSTTLNLILVNFSFLFPFDWNSRLQSSFSLFASCFLLFLNKIVFTNRAMSHLRLNTS
jgi:hypothetical protein